MHTPEAQAGGKDPYFPGVVSPCNLPPGLVIKASGREGNERPRKGPRELAAEDAQCQAEHEPAAPPLPTLSSPYRPTASGQPTCSQGFKAHGETGQAGF